MVKTIVFLKRKHGMSDAQFRDYCEAHGRLVQKYIGHLFLDFKRNYVIRQRRYSRSTLEDVPPAWNSIVEMYFADAASREQAFSILASPEVDPVIEADEKRFLDCSNITALECDEMVTS